MNEIYSRAPHRPAVSVDAHTPHAALLIDFDNVTMGIRSNLGQELRKLLNSDIIRGKVSVQRAYADWRRYPQYIVSLSEASIDLIFAPAYGSTKKNATDIRLAIDALEIVFIRPEIGTFILLSGDSDFSSLVLKLKEYGKYVIGVGHPGVELRSARPELRRVLQLQQPVGPHFGFRHEEHREARSVGAGGEGDPSHDRSRRRDALGPIQAGDARARSRASARSRSDSASSTASSPSPHRVASSICTRRPTVSTRSRSASAWTSTSVERRRAPYLPRVGLDRGLRRRRPTTVAVGGAGVTKGRSPRRPNPAPSLAPSLAPHLAPDGAEGRERRGTRNRPARPRPRWTRTGCALPTTCFARSLPRRRPGAARCAIPRSSARWSRRTRASTKPPWASGSSRGSSARRTTRRSSPSSVPARATTRSLPWRAMVQRRRRRLTNP